MLVNASETDLNKIYLEFDQKNAPGNNQGMADS